jgi:hypothetical protein
LLVDTKGRNITDAYIFNNVAAIKVQGFFFVFFKKPLTLASYSTYLPQTTNITKTSEGKEWDLGILAWDFR